MSATRTGPPTAAPPSRGRGRPREFDRDEVLERVTALFWERGYESTSMADIVEASGLNRSSIYNSFGSKESLFALALERYVGGRVAMMTQVLTGGSGGLSDLELFVDMMQTEASGENGPRGCLAVNTSTEFGTRDAGMIKVSSGFRDQMRAALLATLGRAEAAGEIAAGSADRHAAILLSFVLSLGVMARSGADAAELDDHFAAARAMIADWRVDT